MAVPNVPCGVESNVKFHMQGLISLWFLMYRVELKVSLPVDGSTPATSS